MFIIHLKPYLKFRTSNFRWHDLKTACSQQQLIVYLNTSCCFLLCAACTVNTMEMSMLNFDLCLLQQCISMTRSNTWSACGHAERFSRGSWCVSVIVIKFAQVPDTGCKIIWANKGLKKTFPLAPDKSTGLFDFALDSGTHDCWGKPRSLPLLLVWGTVTLMNIYFSLLKCQNVLI